MGPGGWWPWLSSTVSVHPVTHPRVWLAMPQEDARPELLMEPLYKHYPVQVLGQQLLNMPLV